MKIAQIAPLIESVPPQRYGGTERVVSFLTEELVRKGHDVTLFASGDSETSAKLVAGTPAALRLNGSIHDLIQPTMLMLEAVRGRAHEFDILHFHTDLLHFPGFRAIASRTLTTLHGRLDLPDLTTYDGSREMPVVSISFDQRRPLPHARWVGNVPHGLPVELTRFNPNPREGYLAFLGRISCEKRPDRAIAIARRAGMRLRIAAKVDPTDRIYFEREIRPLLDDPLIEWVGEIGDAEKPEFLGEAYALLFPIDWPEPFGLVMIEAMAAGTPTVAYRRGSVPEVIEHARSGLIVDDEDGAVQAVRTIERLDRAGVRRAFEERFTAARMAEDYLELYTMARSARECRAARTAIPA